MRLLKNALCGLAGDKALEVRWRLSSEKPAFCLEFLQMYLTGKYGRLAAIYQLAINSCLVVFEDAQPAYVFSRDPEKGSPYGRLYAKWWRPQPQEATYFQVLKHIEKSGDTRVWFNELMDRVDRASLYSCDRALSRGISARNKTFGPSILPVLARADEIKDVFKVIKAEKKDKSVKPKIEEPAEPDAGCGAGGIKQVNSHSEFVDIVSNCRVTVVKFFATWCIPCSMIAADVERLSYEYLDATFISIDVDENEETADFCNITVLPTFQFFIRGRLMDEVRGNAVKVVENKLQSMQRIAKDMTG